MGTQLDVIDKIITKQLVWVWARSWNSRVQNPKKLLYWNPLRNKNEVDCIEDGNKEWKMKFLCIDTAIWQKKLKSKRSRRKTLSNIANGDFRKKTRKM